MPFGTGMGRLYEEKSFYYILLLDFRSMPVLSFQHRWKKNMIFLWMVELSYLFLVNRGIFAEKTIRYASILAIYPFFSTIIVSTC